MAQAPRKEKRFKDLSKALRDNLLKRKAQQRKRKEETPEASNIDKIGENREASENGGHNRD